jgi:hypothetical protein
MGNAFDFAHAADAQIVTSFAASLHSLGGLATALACIGTRVKDADDLFGGHRVPYQSLSGFSH